MSIWWRIMAILTRLGLNLKKSNSSEVFLNGAILLTSLSIWPRNTLGDWAIWYKLKTWGCGRRLLRIEKTGNYKTRLFSNKVLTDSHTAKTLKCNPCTSTYKVWSKKKARPSITLQGSVKTSSGALSVSKKSLMKNEEKRKTLSYTILSILRGRMGNGKLSKTG